ncbi:MAG: hypothetical protein ABH834_00660 [Candidatus Altiarchaeota archaeon]
MVKRIRVDPGKKAPFKPDKVSEDGPAGTPPLTYLERLRIELEKDPDTRLPQGMTPESLANLIDSMSKRQEAEADRNRQSKRK